ncbi:MarR family transcriptional regulator [Lancefieldella sp. Marseille-Q7238]|uniref:MarR family transcriptional regulator n=1 Tax=Lancefieldella sp. Marseille-Q7238 TaxID=3022127 RepID=UPI0024A9B0E8|nr:MarR family transcriptional regulator [Lancefieldella sp. Marseille-Q7238]
MELREYMSIRRSYNLVRRSVPANRRLTFEEFAILCRLNVRNLSIKTSEIAEYQGALRPTITHRTSHLAKLGYINRKEGSDDRRNVVCELSERGRTAVFDLARLTCARIAPGQALSRTSAERICMYVDAMGSVFCRAGDLVLLCLQDAPKGTLTVNELVEELGLLQPTVSMSITSLAGEGLIQRLRNHALSRRTTTVTLTEEGRKEARALRQQISRLVVKRKARVSV